MQALKFAMKQNMALIPFLILPWLLAEIIETFIYIIHPEEQYKPSFERTFSW